VSVPCFAFVYLIPVSVLHNPHLGLSETLHELYDCVKPMADCVVPQEYGSTIAEKKSVGVKICHGLLDKIKYDLVVARKDNEVDMRYLINLAYQSDLNINTLGRRIRTRLYFTSESHLHTVLSVMRFANDEGKKSLLSPHGMAIVNSTAELCYLTQIVFRVFEDSRREMDDPKRFRVEILFSPGATATPFHMHEQERDHDASRFDTAPLQMIGREGLTCREVEDFFDVAILAGRTDDDTELDIASTSTTRERPLLHDKIFAENIDVVASRSTNSAQPVSSDKEGGSGHSQKKGGALTNSRYFLSLKVGCVVGLIVAVAVFRSRKR